MYVNHLYATWPLCHFVILCACVCWTFKHKVTEKAAATVKFHLKYICTILHKASVCTSTQTLLLVSGLMRLRVNTNYTNLFAQPYSANTLHKDENANLKSTGGEKKSHSCRPITSKNTNRQEISQHCCTVNITRRDVRSKEAGTVILD